MSYPQPFSREEIKRAHKTLQDVFNAACYSLDTEEQESELWKELEDNVLRFLPDKPEPTMAECAWDSRKHYLAEATLYNDDDDITGYCAIGKVVMLKEVDDDTITVMNISMPILGASNYSKNMLVPTGEYYTVVKEEKQNNG